MRLLAWRLFPLAADPRRAWAVRWGIPAEGAGEYLFTGHRWDPETGLYYARNNELDPTTGRWIAHDRASDDPLGNLYGYCGGNPTNSSDALGLAPPGDDEGDEEDGDGDGDGHTGLTYNPFDDLARAMGLPVPGGKRADPVHPGPGMPWANPWKKHPPLPAIDPFGVIGDPVSQITIAILSMLIPIPIDEGGVLIWLAGKYGSRLLKFLWRFLGERAAPWVRNLLNKLIQRLKKWCKSGEGATRAIRPPPEGFLKNLLGMGANQLKKQLKNLRKKIAEHRAKIAGDPGSQTRGHWEKEIEDFEEQARWTEEEMKRRGIK